MNRPGQIGGALGRWAIVVLLVFLTSCDTPSHQPGVGTSSIDTLAGILHIDNPRMGAWSSAANWTFEVEWAIGGADATGQAAFGEVRGVSLGPDGHVYVLDGQAAEIRVFDRYGEFVKSLGSRGNGPGEFQVPLTLAWDRENRLWIPDLSGRYTVLDSTGDVVEVFSRPLGPVLRRATGGVFDDGGAFLDEMGWTSPEGATALRLIRVNSGGERLDTLPPIYQPRFDLRDQRPRAALGGFEAEVGGGARGLAQVLRDLGEYRPRLVFAVTPKGTWTASSSELRLIQRTLDGDTIRVVETSHRDASGLTNEERSMIEEALRKAHLEPTDFLFARRLVQAIYVHPDGHVLAHIDEATGAAKTVLDIFDPNGRFLGTARTNLAIDPEVPPAFDKNTVVFVTRDSLDSHSVVRAKIIRR